MLPSRLAPTHAAQARRRQLVVGVVVLTAIALVVLALRPGPGSGSGSGPEQPPASAATTSSASTSAPSSSPSPSRTTHTLPDYTTTGWFSRMPTRTGVRGSSGELVTYRVEVEQGSGVTSSQFAHAIDRTLSHRRGWSGGGHHRFQRVTDEQADLTIRLATPKTVDEGCAEGGADTDGYTSCRVGQFIYINLDRWYVGVPHIRDLTVYRQYLINHEVGHGLGQGHERCTAPGWRAPVMLQQTLDLKGCTANPWPRDKSGRPIEGEPTD